MGACHRTRDIGSMPDDFIITVEIAQNSFGRTGGFKFIHVCKTFVADSSKRRALRPAVQHHTSL